MDKIIIRIQYWWYHFRLKYSAIVIACSLMLNLLLTYYVNHTRPSPGGFNSDFDSTYGSSLTLLSIRAILIAICFLSVVLPIMIIHYKVETDGRNCLTDMKQTGRTYWQLLRYYKNSNPYKMDLTEFSTGCWKEKEGVVLGKVGNRVIRRSAYVKGGEGNNYALYALPGDGKTTCQIIPTALRFGGSVLAIDIKSDILNAAKGKRRIKVFAPDAPERSCCYDPLAGIPNMSMMERRMFLEQMAAVIVAEDKESKYWHETARAMFVGIALYCIDCDINTTLPVIAREILKGNAIDWVVKIKDGECEDAQDYTNGFYGSNEKNLSGAYATLAAAVRPFGSGNLAELLSDSDQKEVISTETLYQGYDVYIEIPQDKISVYAPVSSILLNAFLFEFMRRPDISSGKRIRPVLMLLDEFPQLSMPYDYLSAALSTLRSKGISIFLCQQSIAQLQEKYGENGFRAITDCIQNISIMSLQDPASREWAQKLIGSKKVLKVSTSSGGSAGDNMSRGSSSLNAQDTWEPIFRAGDFGNLGNKVIIYMRGKYVLAEKTPWYEA